MPSIAPTLQWLEGLGWTTAIRESAYGYPIVETAHVASVVAFTGLVIMMDLRLIGWAFAQAPLTQMQRRLFPWQMATMVPSLATGLLLACIDPVRYYPNVLFRIKLLLLALAGFNALAFHRKVQLKAERWGEDPELAQAAGRAGALSLMLWSATIVSGRLIAYNWFK